MRDTVAFEWKWRRGHYVAKVVGPSQRYGLEREFSQGTPVKSRSVVKHTLDVGWYETQEWVRGEGKVRAYWACDGLTMVRLPASADIAVALTGPDPGQPGAWSSDRCRCGDQLTDFDRLGFPHCDTCGPTVTDGAALSETEAMAVAP